MPGPRPVRVSPAAAFLPVLLLLTPGARSATINNLYAASTPVPNQSAAARARAFSRDLVAVLVKVSGNPNAGQVAALQPAIADAGKLIVEYRYRSIPAAQGGGLALWAHFDPKAVDALLAQAGQGIWGQERPTIVAWVLTPSGILGDNLSSPVVQTLRQAARDRGLPLVIPLMDLADQQQVSAFDVRTVFLPALRSASKRYGAQAMIVGTISYADQGVKSDWTLDFRGSAAPFSVTAATPQAAAAAGLGEAATYLAHQLAYQPGSGTAGVVVLSVDGIGSLAGAVRVQRIASAVQGVNGVVLAGIAGGVVRYRIKYAGVPADLARALSLSGALSPAPAPVTVAAPASAAVAASNAPELHFHYIQ